MFSLWLPRNTICFYIWMLYFAIFVSLLVLIVLHRIHSDCLILSYANRDSLISCSSGHFILLSVCGPFILLSICGPGKNPQYKAEWKPREHVLPCTSLEWSTSIQKNARRMSLSWTCSFLVWFSGCFFALSGAPTPCFPAQRWYVFPFL